MTVINHNRTLFSIFYLSRMVAKFFSIFCYNKNIISISAFEPNRLLTACFLVANSRFSDISIFRYILYSLVFMACSPFTVSALKFLKFFPKMHDNFLLEVLLHYDLRIATALVFA
jgi:hypothetical protein